MQKGRTEQKQKPIENLIVEIPKNDTPKAEKTQSLCNNTYDKEIQYLMKCKDKIGKNNMEEWTDILKNPKYDSDSVVVNLKKAIGTLVQGMMQIDNTM